MLRTALVTLACGTLLSACGETTLERGTTGAGLGAAGGAAVGAATDLGVGTGALIGGAAGGAAGALTEEEQVDLGEPIWEQFGDDEELVEDEDELF